MVAVEDADLAMQHIRLLQMIVRADPHPDLQVVTPELAREVRHGLVALLGPGGIR